MVQLLTERIHSYFVNELGMPDEQAMVLHRDYYTKYGLALRGLLRHHDVDGLDFDKKCDQSLPLEDFLKPDPAIRRLLLDIDRTKARVWALTNAYITHARRVLHILKLDDLIEDIVYCDYSTKDFVCKPEIEYYTQALEKANVQDPSKCFFVDDNLQNVRAAKRVGWGSCVHYREPKETDSTPINQIETHEGVDATIESLEELRVIWPHIFKSARTDNE
ncbi:hypothetical protein Clacol_001606 [Clathrus columnatus]|uniref:Pyrimidine 5-nucleotidase n=1 Tax=Clathrus columnatus TaxID=1419009 RepID=A0AAV5A3S7_9AGAM|nr:hypothetical protein Clacol_001606 [Clathrus columnatus]